MTVKQIMWFMLFHVNFVPDPVCMLGRRSLHVNVNVKDPLDINVKGYDP